MIPLSRAVLALLVSGWLLAGTSCHTGRPLTFSPRKGDEIVVAGRLFHTGTPVTTWMDPYGYDAYRVERRFSPLDESGWEKTAAATKGVATPNRYGLRRDLLPPEDAERVRGGGWDLPTLRSVVDQFVIHYDQAGFSKNCFKILHDLRGLSVHFMLDVDGTIYQTLDLKERAWQATSSNSRSVGIEIANIGAYRPGMDKILNDWYPRDTDGRAFLRIPERFGDPLIFTKDFVGRPARPEPVRGTVQGNELVQYDLTPQQYAALTKLTAALCRVFPRMTCDYPRDAAGGLMLRKLPEPELQNYHGVLGHFHVQANKIDPGPAFDWDRVINGARRILGLREIPRTLPTANPGGTPGD